MTVQRTSFRPRCRHSIQQQGMWRHNLGYTWVDIVLPDYSLPFRSPVHHFSEQERSGILVLCRMTRKVNLYYHFEHKFPCSKYTSPFGTPSSIQETPFNKGTQNFVPEKWTHNFCNCFLYWTNISISIQGKGSLFLGPFQRTPRLSKRDWPQRAQVTMMTAFTTWTISLKAMYCTCGNEWFSSNRILMFCAQDFGIARGQHCESLQRIVWRGVVSPLKAVSLDIECRTLPWFYEKRRWLMLVRWNFKFLCDWCDKFYR